MDLEANKLISEIICDPELQAQADAMNDEQKLRFLEGLLTGLRNEKYDEYVLKLKSKLSLTKDPKEQTEIATRILAVQNAKKSPLAINRPKVCPRCNGTKQLVLDTNIKVSPTEPVTAWPCFNCEPAGFMVLVKAAMKYHGQDINTILGVIKGACVAKGMDPELL